MELEESVYLERIAVALEKIAQTSEKIARSSKNTEGALSSMGQYIYEIQQIMYSKD